MRCLTAPGCLPGHKEMRHKETRSESEQRQGPDGTPYTQNTQPALGKERQDSRWCALARFNKKAIA